MTVKRALPAAVLERLARAAYGTSIMTDDEWAYAIAECRAGRKPHLIQFFSHAEHVAAELLAIIEERAEPGWQIHCMRDGLSDYVLIDELLEDSDA